MAEKLSERPAADLEQIDTSDEAMLTLLNRVELESDPEELRKLYRRIERTIFHKQFTNA